MESRFSPTFTKKVFGVEYPKSTNSSKQVTGMQLAQCLSFILLYSSQTAQQAATS